ncbi:MAG: biotin--[acetyl-CoA-carboxylase] ligase [Lewinella sp.]
MLVPKVARRFARMGSTNDALLQAMSGGQPVSHGSVYITNDQTAGRGQGANRWFSTPGANLTFSMLVQPDLLAVDRIFALTQFASLSVTQGLASYLPELLEHDLRIKWPNDLYVGNRKIGGILIQNGLRGSRIQWSVIGVGLNVNEHHFPTDLQASATSIYQVTGKVVDKEALLHQIFEGFREWYGRLDRKQFAKMDGAYHDHLYRYNERHHFRRMADGHTFAAVVKGVDAQGQLILTTDDGEQSAFELRSIQWLR